jgi:hypothetical protein
MITQKKEQIECKGKDAYSVDCYKNYVFLSNDKKPVFCAEGDRRFQVFECAVSPSALGSTLFCV